MAGVIVCLCCLLRGFREEKKFEFSSHVPYKVGHGSREPKRGQVRVSPRGFHGLDVWVVVLFCNPSVKIRRSLNNCACGQKGPEHSFSSTANKGAAQEKCLRQAAPSLRYVMKKTEFTTKRCASATNFHALVCT